ncbi:hypothetical protein LTR50_005592 [Elasticomyces elasticus]|nr:hypothetical protein LTR50_005592 [Elasticomyces elasticus]
MSLAQEQKILVGAAAAKDRTSATASMTKTPSAADSVTVDLPLTKPTPSATQSFRFFDLPGELRLQIYELILLRPDTIDLHPQNYRMIHPGLNLLLVSHRMQKEASRVFFGSQTQVFRLYPTHGRFFHTKRPLLARLPPSVRAQISTMELRLGPGWSAPPRGWHTGPSLGLADATSLRTLKVFVEIDPSDDIFQGFRGQGHTEEFYTLFCVALVKGFFAQVQSLETVELDAWRHVRRSAPLIGALVQEIEKAGKTLVWGPLKAEVDAGSDKDNAHTGVETT